MNFVPFDPAKYLDNEETIAAFLADARLFGAEDVSRAEAVVERARKMHALREEPARKVG